MRIRANIKATVQTVLEVHLPESWNLFLSDVTDTLVIFWVIHRNRLIV